MGLYSRLYNVHVPLIVPIYVVSCTQLALLAIKLGGEANGLLSARGRDHGAA